MNLTIKMKDNPSKKEEIDALKLIASAIPEDSYLKTFFCDSLVRWVEINIRDDFRRLASSPYYPTLIRSY